MAKKKVNLTISGLANVADTHYHFCEESALDTIVRAYVDGDSEARGEIESYGGPYEYYLDELASKPKPKGLPSRMLSCMTFSDLSLREVVAVFDGKPVVSKTWPYHEEWLADTLKEIKATAVIQEEDLRKPIFDLIGNGQLKKVYAVRTDEVDQLSFCLEYEFSIEGEFDFNKFQFIKAYDDKKSFIADKAFYDGKLIKGKEAADHYHYHMDCYLSVFTAKRERKIELDSY